jgi:hypothetical protein
MSRVSAIPGGRGPNQRRAGTAENRVKHKKAYEHRLAMLTEEEGMRESWRRFCALPCLLDTRTGDDRWTA